MTDRELRKLSRAELYQQLQDQKRENELLYAQLQQTQRLLEKRQISIDQSGSIAEAALRLSGIFEAAEVACQQYT